MWHLHPKGDWRFIVSCPRTDLTDLVKILKALKTILFSTRGFYPCLDTTSGSWTPRAGTLDTPTITVGPENGYIDFFNYIRSYKHFQRLRLQIFAIVIVLKNCIFSTWHIFVDNKERENLRKVNHFLRCKNVNKKFKV